MKPPAADSPIWSLGIVAIFLIFIAFMSVNTKNWQDGDEAFYLITLLIGGGGLEVLRTGLWGKKKIKSDCDGE